MQVFCLHDIELGDEGINRLIFFVDVTCVFKLGAQMQLLLDLVLVFEDAVNPTLI